MSKLLRIFFLSAALAFGVTVAAAQEHSAPAATQEQHGAGHEQAAPADPNRALGDQLAHESKEAAAEDDHAKFKESAAVKWLARITGLPVKAAYWVAVVLNFVIIAFFIYWFSRSSIPAMFRNRTVSIQKGLEEARQASQEANSRLSAIEERLSKLDAEVAEVKAASEEDFRGEEQRIRQAAEEDARRIVQAAEQEIAAATKLARRELTGYAADLAVNLAAKKIQVSDSTDRALVRHFVGQLGESDGKDGK